MALMKASSTWLSAGLIGRAGAGSVTGVAVRLISRVVAKARTLTRPTTRRPRTIVLGVIQSCSRTLARDIIVSAAERPASMAAPTGRSLTPDFDVKAKVSSRAKLDAACLDPKPGEGLGCRRRVLLHSRRRWSAGPRLAVLVRRRPGSPSDPARPEEHTSELQSLRHLVCRLLLPKK